MVTCLNSTLRDPPFPSSMSATHLNGNGEMTTWALVRINPLASMMMPVPEPSSLARLTTEG
jgi:hypothetical protein